MNEIFTYINIRRHTVNRYGSIKKTIVIQSIDQNRENYCTNWPTTYYYYLILCSRHIL